MSLGSLENDSGGVVLRLHGGRGMRDHLFRLGIVPGVRVRMVHGGNRGPIVLEVLGSNVMLGRELAEKIEIRQFF